MASSSWPRAERMSAWPPRVAEKLSRLPEARSCSARRCRIVRASPGWPSVAEEHAHIPNEGPPRLLAADGPLIRLPHPRCGPCLDLHPIRLYLKLVCLPRRHEELRLRQQVGQALPLFRAGKLPGQLVELARPSDWLAKVVGGCAGERCGGCHRSVGTLRPQPGGRSRGSGRASRAVHQRVTSSQKQG